MTKEKRQTKKSQAYKQPPPQPPQKKEKKKKDKVFRSQTKHFAVALVLPVIH